MSADTPDLGGGIAASSLADGAMLEGRLNGEAIILVRRGAEVFALGASCTHYSGPLAQGLVVGDEIRCPLHHACFSLRTGQVLRAPALDAIPCWRVERVQDRWFVRERVSVPPPPASNAHPSAVVIVGGGAAGLSAALTLRREGYRGALTLLSADDTAPYDRPNLSKDYLAGKASPEWMPLRSPEFYAQQKIDLLLNTRVTALDTGARRVRLADGRSFDYERLLLATGADPIQLPIPGAAPSQLCYLRSFADCGALIGKVASARRVVLVGSGFIGLEVAAALRERGVAVHVVSLDAEPLVRVLGREVGAYIRRLHESHGVVFHLGDTVTRVEGGQAVLGSGTKVLAELIVLGLGVRPTVALAEQAGLKTDHGVVVDEYLETSAAGVFAAGDIARWPDAHSGSRIRVEHWVVAERQGQIAARNMLGHRARFDAVPFFWTEQFGVTIRYVGHAEHWDDIAMDGSLEASDCRIRYRNAGKTLAVATLSRDLDSLRAEAAMETGD